MSKHVGKHMSKDRSRLSPGLKKVVSIAVMGSVCLTAAASVGALTKTFEVTDVTVTMEDRPCAKNYCMNVENVSLNENGFYTFDTNTKPVMNVQKESDHALSANDDDNAIEWISVKLNLRGKKSEKQVPAGTVSDILSYLNIELTKYDSLNAAMDQVIEDNDEIVVTRKVVMTVKEQKDIEFKTIEKKDDTLFEGDSIIRKAGKNGKKEVTVKKVYVNGKLDSKTELDSVVLEEPVDRIMVVGSAKNPALNSTAAVEEEAVESDEVTTAPVQTGTVTDNNDGNTFTDASGVVRHYEAVLNGSGTAYFAEPGAGTATGRLAQYGVVAVNPNIIPYGSKLYIVSDDGEIIYGDAVAGDTGGALMENWILVDLFYPTFDECCVFGRRDVTVYILEYGNEFR